MCGLGLPGFGLSGLSDIVFFFFVFLFFLAGEQRDGVGLSGRFILLIAVYTAEPLVP